MTHTPQKWKKKPVIVEVMRFTGDNCYDVLRFIKRGSLLDVGLNEVQQTDMPVIPTPEGDAKTAPGDWIVKIPGGGFYVCTPEAFDLNYEPATTPEPTDPAAELASLRAEVERLKKENQTLSDILQGKDDAIAELRHDVEELRQELDQQTFREELDESLPPPPKEPPDAQVRPR